MKPPPFTYARPTTLDAALALLATSEDTKVLAGGQSLIPMMNLRLARPELLVDIGRLEELKGIRHDNGCLVIGAGMRQSAVEHSDVVREACPLLAEALHFVAHPQIRVRGTIGGSIAHADPASELCAVALALDATVAVAGPGGARTIPAAELFFGPYMTSLEDDEILTEIRFPISRGLRTAFAEVARRSRDFAVAGVAAVVGLDAATRVDEVRLAGLGVSGAAVRLTAAERTLLGESFTAAAAARAGAAAAAEVDPVDDLHADADTRRATLSAVVQRALATVAAT